MCKPAAGHPGTRSPRATQVLSAVDIQKVNHTVTKSHDLIRYAYSCHCGQDEAKGLSSMMTERRTGHQHGDHYPGDPQRGVQPSGDHDPDSPLTPQARAARQAELVAGCLLYTSPSPRD